MSFSIRLSIFFVSLCLLGSPGLVRAEETAFEPLEYEIELQPLLEHNDGHFLWFHPRVAPLPELGRAGKTAAIMTLQKHLHRSDYYSGLSYMTTTDGGTVWSGTIRPDALGWIKDGDVNVSAADVTPGWHAPTRKVLAVGAEVRYNEQGDQLSDVKRAHQTIYSVYDPKTHSWSNLRRITMPEDDKFDFAYSACAQWLTLPDGTILLPFYFGESDKQPCQFTVARFQFDGEQLEYLEHGTEIRLDVDRGLVEPSITFFQGRFYLTLRNDQKGYVTTS
ncbi:MAG: hypothetical protein KDA65_11650, partial [Planctomycetaceae bacterium]|nr:hypothetical protein [Planctomycetaceae bacterium]